MALAWNIYSCFQLIVCCHFIAFSTASFKHNKLLSDDNHLVHRTKHRRQTLQTPTYQGSFSQHVPVPENVVDSGFVFFDLNSVLIDGKMTSSFSFKVIITPESVPQVENLFIVDNSRNIRFSNTTSSAERAAKKYLDYEQNTTLVIILEATPELDPTDIKLIKVTIPLADVNDELPVLKNKPFPYLAAIPLEPDAGHIVYVLLAEDPDTNSQLDYLLDESASTEVRNHFHIVMVNDGKFEEGHIKVTRRTKFNLGQEFNIPIVIRDKMVITQSINAVINVKVGSRPPQFFQEKYIGSIYETQSINNPVFEGNSSTTYLHIQVHQFQQGYPKTFYILDESKKESTQFRIDENGNIYNKDALDFDVQITQRPPKFRLFIQVKEQLEDGFLENYVPLEITIKDDNDNAPRFQLTQYLNTIREDEPIGKSILTVVAEDNDSGENGRVTYELNSTYFGVKMEEKNKGVIYVKEKLDFDAYPGPTYRFIVYAKDHGVPSQSSSVDVTVTTYNVNDEKPKIIQPEQLVLRDVVPDNFILTRLRATDADGDNVKFYFTPFGEKYEIFTIKPSSGIIQVSAGTVPSNVNTYTLNITAVDDGSCCGGTQKLESHASFQVQIVEAVNQKPIFVNCLNYSKASFKEESPPGTPIIRVSAEDKDRGLNGKVTYTIESPSPTMADAPFNIDSVTGQITVKSKVNLEALDKDYIQVTVKGSDNAQSPQEGWCTFRVTVEDINDNPPVFSSASYTEKISSNAQVNRVILRVGATDRDVGNNAKIVYSIVKDKNNASDVFGIYPESGLIFLKSHLVAGRTEYRFVVQAQDSGITPQSGTATVKIEVATETSEPPKFDPDPISPSYAYRIAETVTPNTQDAVITTLSCKSNMANPRVQFFLVDPRGTLQSQQAGSFAITEFQQGGHFMVNVSVAQQLDYEKVKQYSVILRCQNFGGLTMYDQITLTIDVEDRNNKVPYFAGMDANGRYAGTVPENTNSGATVIEVQGYDDDVSEAYNRLQFELSSDSYPGVHEDFKITALPGNKAAIVTLKEFDRELTPRFFLTVTANDRNPSDRPNHKPLAPNSASVVVQVDITDKNDNPMTFKQSLYNQTVPETAAIGTVIFAVTADDIDEVDHGRLKYNFLPQKEAPPFDIRDQTGEIVVNGKLDYESNNKVYNLILESRDSENFYSATTSVVIYISDENDNPPVFAKSEYIIADKVVEEDTSISKDNPMELIRVTATDADLSRTTKMRYYLRGKGTEPGDKQLFYIEQDTGRVFLVAALDRDEPNGKSEYIFTVEARDEDENYQSGYTNIKVKPLDINDNRPIFDENRLTGEVFEHSPPGWYNKDDKPPIAVVITNDFDFGINSSVDYEIVSSPTIPTSLTGHLASTTNFFNIDKDGRIFSQVDPKYLDRETRPKLEVVVRAKDGGPDPQTSTATVTIILKDINDNSPVFTQKTYNVTMSEHFKDGIVTEVHATDKDENDNAELFFSMSQANAAMGHFKVDTIENKGAISIKEPVDYEKPNERYFELEIIVRDKDLTHTDTAQVRIWVEDFNDNAPMFKDSHISRSIEENAEPGDVVATFVATDSDSGINALFSYLIDRESDQRREFIINPETGEVKTRKKLDREVDSKMTILIKAVDKGDPKQTGTATLQITVSDVNDNFPIFREDYRPIVKENLQDGFNGIKFPLKVIEVFAIDKDSAINGPPFGFSLPENCEEEACKHFTLKFNENADSGDGSATILTSSVFDREQSKYYKLPIVMWDLRGSGNPKAQTGTNTLTITVGDVNDNPHFPGHQDIFVYNYKGLFGPVVIGQVYAEDLDDWDLPDKTFNFLGPASMKHFFSVNNKTGEITMKKGVRSNYGGTPYEFKVEVYDKVFDKTVVSTVSVVVKELSEEAILNSGALRLTGITASEFISESKDPRTGVRSESLYTQFRKLLAEKLGFPSKHNIEIVTLRDGPDYLEVRYAAHGSPYISSAQADTAIILNKETFERLGIQIMAIPIDECLNEIFEGGCFNKLHITGKPLMINSNGTSFVGVEAYLVATQGCEADKFPESNDCAGDYCYNGGTCKKDLGGTLLCSCYDGFDGPRCQQRRHHYNGNSVSIYPTLQQCEVSQTSIEFITDQEDGVIFYNGPLDNIDPLESPQDFILLELRGGFPTLLIDHGTGMANLTLDGRDEHSNQLMQKLNDGRWHHIDINRNGKYVELVVDRCLAAIEKNNFVESDKVCRVIRETPGENIFLNVNTHLHVGGLHTSVKLKHLNGSSLKGFKGCIRNLIHNKKLYDLHFREMPGLNSGKNGCPPEDVMCAHDLPKPFCGVNGVCEATLDGKRECRCRPGWFGSTCNKAATIRDFDKNSYYLWEMKEKLFNSPRMTSNRDMDVQLMFRTRQTSGILMDFTDSTSTESTRHIRLLLNDGKIRLTYNLGDGDKHLDLTHARANNGQWHVLRMERHGREFHLKLDGGEGKNYNFTLKSVGSEKERHVFRLDRHVYSGAYKQGVGLSSVLIDDLIHTCIQDVRVNNGYFPMTHTEQSDPDAMAIVEENQSTKENCERHDCLPGICEANRECIPLWETYECSCVGGFRPVGEKCVSGCHPNPCFNNVSCAMDGSEIICQCPPGWTGDLCDALSPEGVKSGDLSDGALVAILVSFIAVLLLALSVFLLYKFCPHNDEGEKYILEVDPDDDIRENVMNYDEEGAGEEDQDAYDLSRLQKPTYETPLKALDVSRSRNYLQGNAPRDKADIGSFIDDRMKDANNDEGAPPHDAVREYSFEGEGSDAGSLSSLSTSSSDQTHDYDYLNDWGPKFSLLADMYGAGQVLEQD
ncbi:neural-cadherin-like [Biomphalaria glabrata]|uniref:Neural-cadherin-like n=1 Tax=Biomphalaria glabrata TaxID=6526 RepID=A0A9W3AW49_BIOGL|nr:neural-cadherin-like [Biomphalaria glabrata]